ncbi:unnamed protein product, partial [Prunus brigantina]
LEERKKKAGKCNRNSKQDSDDNKGKIFLSKIAG